MKKKKSWSKRMRGVGSTFYNPNKCARDKCERTAAYNKKLCSICGLKVAWKI